MYSTKSRWYFSLSALACRSYVSFSVGARFCQFSPTSFAISVKLRFWLLRSSLILLENKTYADGGRSGAFSSALGCRRYFLLATGWPSCAASGRPWSGRTPSALASSSVGLTGDANETLGEMPRALAIRLWSFLLWPSLTPSASRSDSWISRIISHASKPCSMKASRYCVNPNSPKMVSTTEVIQPAFKGLGYSSGLRYWSFFFFRETRNCPSRRINIDRGVVDQLTGSGRGSQAWV